MIEAAAGKVVRSYLFMDHPAARNGHTTNIVHCLRNMRLSLKEFAYFARIDAKHPSTVVHLFTLASDGADWRYQRWVAGSGNDHFASYLSFLALLLAELIQKQYTQFLFRRKDAYLWSGPPPLENETGRMLSVARPDVMRVVMPFEEMSAHQTVDPDAPLRRLFPLLPWGDWRGSP